MPHMQPTRYIRVPPEPNKASRLSPGLLQSADHIGQLAARHHVRRIFVRAQFAVRARHPAQVVAAAERIALRIERMVVDVAEHDAARHRFVVDGAIAVVGEELLAIEHGQRQRHGERIRRADVAVDVAEGVALRMALGLLESELDDELEEVVLRLEGARDVGGPHCHRLDGEDDGNGSDVGREPVVVGHS